MNHRSSSYAGLRGAYRSGAAAPSTHRTSRMLPLTLVAFFVLALVAILASNPWSHSKDGVSDKSSDECLGRTHCPFPWSNEMLLWQRTGFHFQPESNWMNDPNGKIKSDASYDCSTSKGAAERGALGPFGLLILTNQDLSEQTATYFYVNQGVDGRLRTHFCQDETRSSKATDIIKRVVGSTVPVLDGENLSLRILVDHSIVESFAQGGRSCITSRVYPTNATSNAARIYVFNNATSASVTAKSLKIWEMNSTFIQPYPFQF